jgi:hypothetical protein
VNLSETMKIVCVKQLCLCETLINICQTADDLGNTLSKVNDTCILKAHHNYVEETIDASPQLNNDPNIKGELLSTFTKQNKHLTSNQSYVFDRSRSQCIRHSKYARKRDREPSRIPMKKFVHLMTKNKTRRRRIKSLIKQFIPKSSCWHNLLSTRYRKYVIHKPTNTNMWQFRKPTITKFAKNVYLKRGLKITNKHTTRTRKHKLFKLNKTESKCNVQRIKTCGKLLLFVCGDIELNPGPVNTSAMSMLTTRLARIG